MGMSKLSLSITNKIISLMTLFLSLSSIPVLAGDFQGGGGGTLNQKVRVYLDTRSFAIDARNKYVVPSLAVLNTCKDGDLLHTINKVSTCADYDTEVDLDTQYEANQNYIHTCKNFEKRHLFKQIPENGLRVCNQTATKLIAGVVKNVCLEVDDHKRKPVKYSFKLDVYRKDFTAHRFNNFANTQKDHFVRKITYQIPDCSDVDVESE